MKRLPIILVAMLLLTLFVVGCNGIPAPPAAPQEGQNAVDVAVEATLTAIAGSEAEESESIPTPQPDPITAPEEGEVVSESTQEPREEGSPSGLVLPPSVTDFQPAARPAASKGAPDAPVVIYEWSDYT